MKRWMPASENRTSLPILTRNAFAASCLYRKSVLRFRITAASLAVKRRSPPPPDGWPSVLGAIVDRRAATVAAAVVN